MYIIGGKLKGRKLAKCKSGLIRPAMALIRKSIFDTLRDFVDGANVLDLCAGSGVIGIEALSRGAKQLTLIDSDKDAVNLIKKNLELCNLKAKVILGRIPKALNKLTVNSDKYNLIFLDPPYGKSNFIENTLEVIMLNKLLTNDGLISIESELKSNYVIPKEFKLFKEKRFGNTKITILKNAN